MNTKTFKILSFNVAWIFLLAFPFFVFAQDAGGRPATSIGGSQGTLFGITYECSPKNVNGVQVYGECTFYDLVAAVLNLIDWATGFALGFCVFVIAYAGFKLMISGDNPGERKAAKTMMTKVLIGIGFIIGAWLIVRLITSGLGVDVGIINLTTS